MSEKNDALCGSIEGMVSHKVTKFYPVESVEDDKGDQ